MEKINVAELLKDCPQGMELDCTVYEDCKFLDVETEGNRYLIRITTPCGIKYLDKYGCYTTSDKAKCVIFPKGKTTWEGFHRPFRDGDILAYQNAEFEKPSIYIYKYSCELNTSYYVVLSGYDSEFMVENRYGYALHGNDPSVRFATEEEKQKLFDAIKAKGYKWNEETKTLEKLIKPKFKVGDRVKTIYGDFQYDIKELTDTHYTLVEVEYKYEYTEPIIEDKNWELVPNKFNINTLIPFESKVLVRGCNSQEWVGEIFTRYNNKVFDNCNFVTLGGICWKQCIPYNDDTKHLLGNTSDCDEYYKTWE